jgi:3-hydroxymyristoyl/3-hydroxydecanoyl-(acyl carrier protein) dehydratase
MIHKDPYLKTTKNKKCFLGFDNFPGVLGNLALRNLVQMSESAVTKNKIK